MAGDPLQAEWRVLIRDQSGAIVDEIDNWLVDGGGLVVEPVFNDVGAFTLSMSADGVSARIINETCGLIVTRNDAVVFSGQILTEFSRTATTITCGGLSDEYLLQRPALPDPLGPPYTTPYNVVTGQASAVMRQLSFNNLSAPYCRADRIVSNLLIATDPALGGSLTGRAGGEELISVLQQIAATPVAGGLGFRILQTSATASTRTLSFYAPVDRSGEVQFSVDYGTATAFEDVRAAPEANSWYVQGGDGLGNDNRTTVYDRDAASIATWGLLEKVYDARGITSPSELNVKLAELMANTTGSRRVTVTPYETESLQYIDHWNVGDVVTFVGPDGVPFVDVIRSARITMGRDGVRVTPVVSEAGSSNNQLIAQHLASVQDRLSNIERNWTVPDSSVTLAMMTADSVSTPQYVDHSLQAVHLDAIDTPANNEVATFDSGTSRLKWFSFTELAGTTATLNNLTVTHNTILGTTAGSDLLTVNAVETHNGSTLFKALTQISNSALTVLASFDPTAGAQKVTLGNQTTPGLYVDASRTIVGSVTALSGAGDDKLSVVGGALHVSTNSSDLALGLRYGTGGAVVAIGPSAASNPDLVIKPGGTTETFRVGHSASTYQAVVTGAFQVTGNANANKIVLNGTTFVGSEVLRVVSGSSRFEGTVTITSGGLTLSGPTNIDGNGGTAGQLRIGGVIVNAASFSGSESLRVGGTSRLEGTVTVTTGNVVLSAGSVDASNSSIFRAGLTVQAGGTTTDTLAVGVSLLAVGSDGLINYQAASMYGSGAGGGAALIGNVSASSSTGPTNTSRQAWIKFKLSGSVYWLPAWI